METICSDEARIYQHQARRNPGHDPFIDSRALYNLFSQTIDPTAVRFPFSVHINLMDEIRLTPYGYCTGMVEMFPYRYYDLLTNKNPLLASFREKCLLEPMFGLTISISQNSLDPSKEEDLKEYFTGEKYDPRIIIANFIFLHEWYHAYRAAKIGPQAYSEEKAQEREDEAEQWAKKELGNRLSSQSGLVIRPQFLTYPRQPTPEALGITHLPALTLL